MQPHETIDAEIVILPPSEGGRITPLSAGAYRGRYRPHIVLLSPDVRQAKIEVRDGLNHVVDEYLGIAFWSGPDPIPVSSPFHVTLALMYAPNPIYDPVVPGVDFTIREGAKVVGYGRVVHRTAPPSA